MSSQPQGQHHIIDVETKTEHHVIDVQEFYQKEAVEVDPSKVNVDLGSVINLPEGFASHTAVPVRWIVEWKTWSALGPGQLYNVANYISCHGYTLLSDGNAVEVLVFIAKEMVDMNYAWHPRAGAASVQKPEELNKQADDLKEAKKKPQFTVSSKWQYGWLSKTQRFLVYHPKSRKPFQHRFVGALSGSPSALGPLVSPLSHGVGAPFANEDLNYGWSAGPAAATIGAINAIPYALKMVWDGLDLAKGHRLEDFKPEAPKTVPPKTGN